MPCGGIYPIKGSEYEPYWSRLWGCWVCRKLCSDINETLFVEEFDAAIHKSCLPQFLKTAEGIIVLDHKHEILTEWPKQ